MQYFEYTLLTLNNAIRAINILDFEFSNNKEFQISQFNIKTTIFEISSPTNTLKLT